MFMLTSKKTSYLHISSLLWGESTRDLWIPLTKDQQCERFHVMMIDCFTSHVGEHSMRGASRGVEETNVMTSPWSSTVSHPQWGLVCEHAWIVDLISPIFIAGLLAGCMINANITNKWVGRKWHHYQDIKWNETHTEKASPDVEGSRILT